MSGWSGFTDEELRRMKAENKSDSEEVADSPITEPIKVAKLGRQQKKKANFPRWDAPQAKPSKQQVVMPPKGKDEEVRPAVAPSLTTNEEKPISKCIENNDVKEPGDSKDKPSTSEEEKPDTVGKQDAKEEVDTDGTGEAPKATKEVDEPKDVTIGVLSESERQALEMTSLQQMQHKQKLIEDENKMKQKIIQQRLQEKFKQTQTESQKLKEIHRELKLVDTTFQADIDDLRSKIDEACYAFSHAQKRYEKAEKEYVTAKLDYFDKKDKKDELTEQLYAIIQDNEVKKAKKLEELMTKLSADIAISPVTQTPPATPVTVVTQPGPPPEPTPSVNGDSTSNDTG